jgi:hypothetical protein
VRSATYQSAHWRFRPTPLAASLALCWFGAAHAATIGVNDASEGSVTGKCTLADAVFAVNQAAMKNACVAGDGNNDTIDLTFFTAPTTISFSLPSAADANSALALTKPATIRAALDANGNPLVTLMRSSVTGTPNFRLLATSADLSIDGLGFSGGNCAERGGAIYAGGAANLSLANSSITGNTTAVSGGGIEANCGGITLTKSSVSGNYAFKNGGGIYATNHDPVTGLCVSTISLNTSKITSNTAGTGKGGGVYSFNGNVYAYASTIDHNRVNGRGLYNGGGGLYAYFTAKVIGSTISGNYTGRTTGGLQAGHYAYIANSTIVFNEVPDQNAAMDAPHVSIYFSTITGNSVSSSFYQTGGVGFGVSAHVVGSIIRSNSGDQIRRDGQVLATVTGNYNIIAPPQNNNTFTTYPPNTLNCDPKLGSLADNGGPTLTMALLAGSCALDAGPAAAPPLFPSDQRGAKFARKVGAAVDIGAFEVQANDRIFYDGFGL